MRQSIRFCSECGKQIRPDNDFCTNCGAPIDTSIHTEEEQSDNIKVYNKKYDNLKKHKKLISAIALLLIVLISIFAVYSMNSKSNLQKQLQGGWRTSDTMSIYTYKLDFSPLQANLYSGVGDFATTLIGAYDYKVISGSKVKINGKTFSVNFNSDRSEMTLSPAIINDTWDQSAQTWEAGLIFSQSTTGSTATIATTESAGESLPIQKSTIESQSNETRSTSTVSTTTEKLNDNAFPKQHIVVAGDSLFSIAKMYYGSGDSNYIQLIIDANELSSQAISVGDELTIPSPDD